MNTRMLEFFRHIGGKAIWLPFQPNARWFSNLPGLESALAFHYTITHRGYESEG